jgi:hypothetical protein
MPYVNLTKWAFKKVFDFYSSRSYTLDEVMDCHIFDQIFGFRQSDIPYSTNLPYLNKSIFKRLIAPNRKFNKTKNIFLQL